MAEIGIAPKVKSIGMKNTHRNGGWHLSQSVFSLVGQRLFSQKLPNGLRGGEQVDQGQEGLERETDRKFERVGRKKVESHHGSSRVKGEEVINSN